MIRFPAGTQKRWQCIADSLNHLLRLQEPRTKEECIKQYQVVRACACLPACLPAGLSRLGRPLSPLDQPLLHRPPPTNRQIQATPQKSAHEPGIAKASASASAAASAAPAATSAAVAAPGPKVVKVEAAAAGEAEDGWSQEQQKQLEAGLVRHPASMEKNERWKAIAEGVQGKTKKQCIERYKALRAALQQKKAAAGGGARGRVGWGRMGR